jgi:hypothetical protein
MFAFFWKFVCDSLTMVCVRDRNTQVCFNKQAVVLDAIFDFCLYCKHNGMATVKSTPPYFIENSIKHHLAKLSLQTFGQTSCMQIISHVSNLLYVPDTFYVL